MTKEELKNMPYIIDTLLDEAITDSTKQKVKDKLTEVCQLAIKVLEQQPFINKPCISEGVCREDKIQVLDEIKAEIEQRKKNSGGDPSRDLAFNVCLRIIDKYKLESEDKGYMNRYVTKLSISEVKEYYKTLRKKGKLTYEEFVDFGLCKERLIEYACKNIDKAESEEQE